MHWMLGFPVWADQDLGSTCPPTPSPGLCTQYGLSECQREAFVLTFCLLHSNLEVDRVRGTRASHSVFTICVPVVCLSLY